jgi:hypothetical protein
MKINQSKSSNMKLKIIIFIFKCICSYYHILQLRSRKYLYKGGKDYRYGRDCIICYLYSVCELEGNSICWTVLYDKKTKKLYLHKLYCKIDYFDKSINSAEHLQPVIFEEHKNYYHEEGVSDLKYLVVVEYPHTYIRKYQSSFDKPIIVQLESSSYLCV